MSEFRDQKNRGASGDAAQNPRHLAVDDALEQELLDDLTDWLEHVDEDTFSTEDLDELLYQLDSIQPQPTLDVEASLKEFHEKFQDLFDDKTSSEVAIIKPASKISGSRCFLTKLVPFTAVVAVLFSCMLAAQAFGFDIFAMIGRWTSETFRFERRCSSLVEPAIGSYSLEVGETAQYDSLKEAFEDFAVTGVAVPTWYPEGFESTDTKVYRSPEKIRFVTTYQCGDKSLNMIFEGVKNSAMVEKDDTVVDSLYWNHVEYFFITNQDREKVVWVNGCFEGRITGDVTRDELKEIIYSMSE